MLYFLSGREHALVSGYHRQYTNDDTDLPDELRDIVAKFTDNISSTNNDETETKMKFEENADKEYFVGGHWKYVYRQEDSPTTVSLYVGRSPYSVNSKNKFRIEYRNNFDEVQERHTVQANGIGDVYDTFDVGPDKDAHFWIKECEKNNPINSKLYSYVGVSKPVESDGNHWNGALYYASGQKRYHG
eukprot:527146_1